MPPLRGINPGSCWFCECAERAEPIWKNNIVCLNMDQRLAQAPVNQPDSLYINSSKMPEAAKALDSGILDADITAWMEANGFGQQVINYFSETLTAEADLDRLSATMQQWHFC